MLAKTIILGLLLFLGDDSTSSQSDIGRFRHEAEQTIGKPIHVVDMDSEHAAIGDLGYTTYDNPGYVQIELLSGMSDVLKTNTLAHELGHVILRARNISAAVRANLGPAASQHKQRFMAAVGQAIAVCYIDPLADAEAASRGFHPEILADYSFERDKENPPRTITNTDFINDPLEPSFEALYMYCLSLRPHTFQFADLRQLFPESPAVDKRLAQFQQLGNEKCSDAKGCFEKTKHLRDVAGLGDVILFPNPENGKYE